MRTRRDVVILFLAALLLRLAHIAEVRQAVTFASPVVDARTYDQTARRVAAQGLTALDVPFYQPPLYPIALAGVYRLTGGSTVAPRIVQAVLGALTVALVFGLAAALGRRAAWIAGALMALYGVAIHFEGDLLPPALLLALISAALALLLRADGASRPARPLLGAGILLGLAAAARPSLLLLALGVIAWWARGGRIPARLRSALLLAAAIGIPVLPFTLANLIGARESVLVSTNGGINLYIGNGAHSDSLTAIQPGHHWDKLQIEPLRSGARTGSAESAYWMRRAIREASADPVAWAAALGRKALRLMDVRETPRNTDYEDFRRESRLLSLPLIGFGIVAPLAFLGLLFPGVPGDGARRRRALLATVLVAVAAENLLFFVAGRYRLEAVPALCVLAGIGADAVIRRRGRLPIGAWAGLVAVTAVVWVDFLGERAIDEPRGRIHRAVALQHTGLYARAEQTLREAHRMDPTDVDANRLLGQASARRQDWSAALASFQRAVDGAGDYVLALLGVATSLERLGRADEAEPYYRRAVEADPFDADARLGLGTFLAKRERWSEAREQFSIGLRIDPEHAGLRANLRNLERLQGGSC